MDTFDNASSKNQIRKSVLSRKVNISSEVQSRFSALLSPWYDNSELSHFLNEGLDCQKEANVIARFCLTERKRFNVGANWNFKFPAKIRKKNQAALKWTHAPIFHIDSVSNICSSFPAQNTHAPIWKKLSEYYFQ